MAIYKVTQFPGILVFAYEMGVSVFLPRAAAGTSRIYRGPKKAWFGSFKGCVWARLMEIGTG